MEAFLIYSAKVAIAISAFYMVFLVLFRKQKQFRFNRLYLISTLCISFIIPFITITVFHPVVRQMVILSGTGSEVPATVTDSRAAFNFIHLLFYGYLGVTSLFSLHLLTGHIKAISIIKKCRESMVNGNRIYICEKDIHPFTFFSKIVIAGNFLDHPDLWMILNHEKVHAGEKHTVDILLSELLFLFQWFNPFAWLMKDAIKNNLEFLTDEEVLQYADMKVYQMAMVSLAEKRGITPFLNALNGNDLKNRIVMMKKKTENNNKVTRRLAILPLLVILILGLSNKEFKAASVSFPGKPGITESDVAGPDNLNSDNADTIRTKKKEITVIGYGISKSSPDSSKFRIRSGKTGTQPLYILDGKEIESIEAISPDEIESISVLKDESATAIYGVKGLHGVVLITSKKANKPGSEALIILDGKETTKKVSDINPENIQSVNVLKGESAISEYGEKGKNGVIEITMKHQTDNHIQTIQTVQQLRKHIASSIRYPVKAQEAGQEGSVLIYAFVSDEGKITQITESKPKVDITSVDELVIVAYAVKSDKRPSGNDLSVLNQEGALCVKNLPDLDIPEYKNKWVAFQFKFVLQ